MLDCQACGACCVNLPSNRARGALGREVSCTIYSDRPTPCRSVQPGDALCLRYRAEHGIG